METNNTLKDFLNRLRNETVPQSEMYTFIQQHTNNFDKIAFKYLRDDLNKYTDNIKFTIINEIADESGTVEQTDRPTTVYNYLNSVNELAPHVLTPQMKINLVLNDIKDKNLNYVFFKDDYIDFLHFSDMVETEYNKLNIDIDKQPKTISQPKLLVELSTKKTITEKLDYWISISDEYINTDDTTFTELRIPKQIFEKYFESDFNTPEYAFWMLKYNAYQWFKAKYIDIEMFDEKIKSTLGIDFAKEELKKLLNSNSYGKEGEEYQRIKNGNYKYNVCDYAMGSLPVMTYAKFICFREYLENVLNQNQSQSNLAWAEVIEEERFIKRKKTDFQKQLYPIFETALKNKAIDKPIINLHAKEKLFEDYSIDFEKWLNGSECNESNFIAYLKYCKAEKQAEYQKIIEIQKAEYNKWNINTDKQPNTTPPQKKINITLPKIDETKYNAKWIFDKYNNVVFKCSEECFNSWFKNGIQHPETIEFILKGRQGKPAIAQLRKFIEKITGDAENTKDTYYKTVFGLEIKTAQLKTATNLNDIFKELKNYKMAK